MNIMQWLARIFSRNAEQEEMAYRPVVKIPEGSGPHLTRALIRSAKRTGPEIAVENERRRREEALTRSSATTQLEQA